MSNLVIVAIPAEDDIVWKVSSEKVPHLTLMYLGEIDDDDEGTDTPDVERIAEFVEHALNISQHGPFYLSVDYRGELGPDKADVLFFEGGWDAKWIKRLRGQLLQQTDIREAYDNADQFPDWQPHLTLGYPTAPAKPIPDDRKIYDVRFDRIAVWNDNFDGPEFRLKWPERDYDEDVAVAYGEETVGHILRHVGVKGMKWGQRKSTPSVVERPKNNLSKKQVAAVLTVGYAAAIHPGVRKALAKNEEEGRAFQADKKWEKDFQKAKNFTFDDHKFTNDYNAKWKDHDFSKEDPAHPSEHYKKYVDGYFKEMSTEYARQFAEKTGSSPSGKYEATHVAGTDQVKLRKVDTAAHAAEDGVLATFRVTVNADGTIAGIEQIEDSMSQTTELGEKFVLTHASVLDDPTIKAQIKAKVQDILEDVSGATSGDDAADLNLFGDPLIITKLQSVLNDFYNIGVNKQAAYSAMGEALIEHYGTKGMRWGFRRSREAPAAVAPSASSRVPHGNRRKTQIDTQGGENHPAHEDAIKVAKAQAKLKKSGVSALSNQELRDVSTRVQLEKQVSLLTGHKGKQFVAKQLEGEGKNLARAGLRTGVKTGAKKAGLVTLATVV